MMERHPEIRWIQTGVFAGLTASALYPLLVFAPLPPAPLVAAAAFLGPAIGIGSLGLMRLIAIHSRSLAASLGAVTNLTAGALFTAMALVQLAVRHIEADAPAGGRLVAVWLGLDVAWDVYIGLGTILFAVAMIGDPRFRWPFAGPGLLLGALVVVLNLHTFPTPPVEAGSVDVGPFVGLWYLAATIQAWRSLGWARTQLEATP